tara:strand:+ start:1401 stop:3119 length:1719 start_codon:yes stop_codon:yes gene_type:complete
MEKIIKLRKILKNKNIDGYLIPKNDEFFSEYVDNYSDRLKFISNFSGSFGFALIFKNENYLFVDGRYTLQAKIQSKKFFKIQTIPKEMPDKILKDKVLKIGFNPKLFSKKTLDIFFGKTKCKLIPIKEDLIDMVWIRKGIKKISKFYYLKDSDVGQTSGKKITLILKNLKKKRADYQFITSSENNAWLLNIRGKDSNYTPLPHCHILLDKKRNIYFFCDLRKISVEFKKKFKKVNFYDFSKIELFLSRLTDNKFIIDKNSCSMFFENIISKNNTILKELDPIYDFKSIKTLKEINNIKKAHIYDGAALTKYLFWIKRNYKKLRITEISGENKLLKFRKMNKNFKFQSFPTISSVGPNGSIVHYKANKKTNRVLKEGEIYLVDSGGQYNFGTTDVTRTISLNNNNSRIKNIFTRVLKGHIAVTSFKLNKFTKGLKIDIAARKYLKQVNLDYEHGTGHGVGYFLNVHEGPHAISSNNRITLKKGMIVSNEPGYYEKNKFGIRIENLIYIKKSKKKFFFDNFTMAPIDRCLIDKSLLRVDELSWINSYHKKVFNRLKKFMNKKEIGELRVACSAI